jgi:polyisoprenoid-binding protein YceI
MLRTTRWLAPALLIASLGTAVAAPLSYVLEPEASTVAFVARAGTGNITGRFPVTRADLTLDFDRLDRSTVAVTLNVSKGQANLPFAVQAMKGESVLDAANHPEITFTSTAIRRVGEGAKVDGALTIRGVTRPVTLDAVIWRQQGSAEGSLDELTVRLTGAIRRSDFGATGFNDLVADVVELDILARIERTN